MIYQIVVVEPKLNSKNKKVGDNFIPEEGYSSSKSAIKKLIKSYSKREEVKIVLIPDEITIGLELFKLDGSPYAQIIRSTECFWYVERADGKGEAFFLKDSFEEKFYSGAIVIKEYLEEINQINEDIESAKAEKNNKEEK